MNATEALVDFAGAVLATAARVPESGRFGDRKVFVSAVWDALPEAARDGLSLDSFKRQLFVAHRLGLLVLARADLVAAMPAASVTASQIGYDGVQFHFVLDPTVRDSWAADDGYDEPQQSGGEVRHEPKVRAGLVPRRGASGLSPGARVVSPRSVIGGNARQRCAG
jgi:hypothetical protein